MQRPSEQLCPRHLPLSREFSVVYICIHSYVYVYIKKKNNNDKKELHEGEDAFLTFDTLMYTSCIKCHRENNPTLIFQTAIKIIKI